MKVPLNINLMHMAWIANRVTGTPLQNPVYLSVTYFDPSFFDWQLGALLIFCLVLSLCPLPAVYKLSPCPGTGSWRAWWWSRQARVGCRWDTQPHKVSP